MLFAAMAPSLPEDVFETDAYQRFAADAVARILTGEDLEEHIRWSLDEASRRFAEAFAPLDPSARRGAALAIALQLWSVVPLPSHGGRLHRLQAPARNRPCPCGSGRKHRHCCQRQMPRLPAIDEIGFWKAMAARLAPEHLARLTTSDVLHPDATDALTDEFLQAVNGLLRRGEDARALELIDSVPDLLEPATAYGRVLALYRLGRRGEALAALGDASAELPLVPLLLVEGTPKMPKKGRWHSNSGEADWCWAYKVEMGDLWTAEPGLVDWLGEMVRNVTRHRRIR